jgi:hypothetical protein
VRGKRKREQNPRQNFQRECPAPFLCSLSSPMPSEAAAHQTLTLTLIPFIALTNVTDKFRVRVRVWLCAGRPERKAGAMANLFCSRRDCSFDSRSAISPLRHGTSLALVRAWIDCFVFGSFFKVVSRRGGLLPRFSLSDELWERLVLVSSCGSIGLWR